MSAVVLAGTGLHPFGRFDATITEMGAVAVRAALAEAGIGPGGGPGGGPRGFQAAFCGTAYGGVASGHKVLGTLGLTGPPIIDVEAGCASGAAALMLAASSLRAGQYDCVLCFGIEKMPRGIIRSSFFEPWREEAGLASTPSYFALRAQRLMRERGLTKTDLARVVVKNRANGVDNPIAMFRQPVTADAVLASRVVCDPLHLWMLCSPNEGAAAIVLRRVDAAAPGDVVLDAAIVRSHLPGSVLGEATPMSGLIDDSFPTPSTRASRAAYEAAGIGPSDLDLVELQDTDAARELLAYEELDLCAPGEQAAWMATGHTERTGPLPVNPSGGLLSRGEPLGASALGQVIELADHLRTRAGARQVEGARTALAHTVGRGANASATILHRA